MPTYSDDGQWWWDGRAWQPVNHQPPQQYAGQQPAPPRYGEQQPPYSGQQPPPQNGGQQPTPPRKPRKSVLVIGIVVLAIAVPGGIVAGWRYAHQDDSAPSSTGPPNTPGPAGVTAPAGKNLEPGQPVTEKSLSEVDPKVFYDSVLKRQMTQPLGRLLSYQFTSPDEFTKKDIFGLEDVTIDHATDKFTFIQNDLIGSEPFVLTCSGGKELIWSYPKRTWVPKVPSRTDCTKKPQGGNDGVVTSGLTPEQADKVLAKLRSYPGFVTQQQPTLLRAGGKSYVRLMVDLWPTRAEGKILGCVIARYALEAAGLDPSTWPWSPAFAQFEGIHAVYYLDPATLLPTAAFQRAIKFTLDDKMVPGQFISVVNYSFPKTLPNPTPASGPGSPTLSLPGGWKLQ